MKNLSFAHVGAIRPVQSVSTFYLSLYITALVSIALLLIGPQAVAQTFPTSFTSVQIASGIDPVAMDVALDGRIFLTEKSGRIRVVKNDVLLATPFVTIPNVDNAGERGLLGIALDPNFSSNNFVYVYYTYRATGSTVSNNRVSRFTANGDVAVSGSELILLNIDALSSASNHNGGSLVFKDGKLLITVGDNASGANAQLFTTPKGKILRLNPDGSIPSDNPYYGSTTGINRAIWTLGLRNPFNIAIQPGTGTVFINDVGEGTYEEINEGIAGKNYGWPGIEGVRTTQTPPANYQDPFYAYSHSSGCSITAGEFYNPSVAQFPVEYSGKYFFADYCGNWIRTIDPVTKAVATFATGLSSPVGIKTGRNGSLYVIARGGGGVLLKVSYTIPLPDLTPILYIRPTVQYGTTPFNVVVDVAELNSVATSGSFAVKVNKDAKFSLTFPTGATTVDGRSVQNSAWSFNASDPNYYVLSSSQSIVAGGRLSFGLIGTLSPSVTTGMIAVSCTLQPATMVENKLTNNIDVEKIEYFQQ
ncbi:PQQ-dependent sugar dehydrogenase [Spirosoma validum]|uniref:PQQ-dependent sugar dehydrogenase n=1 Tax=Spirosoma validum TaxID=2771355 RepID=A0A927AZ64_9BACT|nr:PQQ-dependent sugar dehydrogenase [Spirosoma validum]MBD2752554.1 PQQ-dependent sugar dehydrogenase [Spirosoma validum]